MRSERASCFRNACISVKARARSGFEVANGYTCLRSIF